MKTTPTFSTALNCTIAELAMTSLDGAPLAHLQCDEPARLSTKIVFGDQASGEFAKLLMPAQISIRVTFYARPDKPDREVELGSVTLTTIADVLTYTAMLELKDSTAVRLSAAKSYQIGAIVRVGTDPFSIPSLIRGFVEGPRLQSDHPAMATSYATKAIAAPTVKAPTKTPRQKAAPDKSSKQ